MKSVLARRALLGLVLVAAVAVSIEMRPERRDGGSRAAGTLPGTVPDTAGLDAGPETAGVMVDRLQLFRTGEGTARITLEGPELTAILRHAMPGVIPPGVADPAVRIVAGEVRIGARVSPGVLPGGGYLAEAIERLPEWVDVELRGRVRTEDEGSLAYLVDAVFVEGVSLPARVVGLVIGAIGGTSVVAPNPAAPRSDALAEPALRMRWPRNAGVLTVLDDRVLLVRAEPLVEQSVDGNGGA